jgi:peptidoglycan hydrolase CwlO-like protein
MKKYIWEIKDCYEQNKSYCIAFLIVVVIVIAGVWLVCDYSRNKPVYNNTDNAVADIEKRVGNIEQRIDSLSDRLTKAEKTVGGTIVTIRESRENATAVADGISGVEKRLDSAIQRSGRIENLIGDIENANR